MPRYFVHFSADDRQPLPPVATMASVDAEDPPSAVEAMLQTGRVPPAPGLRWACVVAEAQRSGSPARVMWFPIHAGTEDPSRTAYWESFGCMFLIFIVIGLAFMVIVAIPLLLHRPPLPR